MPESKTASPTSHEVLIRREWCKGCELCVEVCKPRVLEMEGIYPVVVDLDACTGCRLCEILCPDFAIKITDTEEGMSSGLSSEASSE